MQTANTVRLLVFDIENRILLMKFVDARVVDPVNPALSGIPMWATLGGGLEVGEDVLAAGQRELKEETGLEGSSVIFGPAIWYGEQTLIMKGTPIFLRETFVVVRTTKSDLSFSGQSDLEKTVIKEMKWWPLTELERTSEIILPGQLRTEARPISRGEYPSTVTMN